MNNKKSITSLMAAGLLALSLSACGQMTGGATDSPTSGSNRPTTTTTTTSPETAESVEVEPEPTSSLTGTDPGILKMGKAFTYSDGLQVTISKPTAVTSSEWASPESTPALSFTVTIVNGTGVKYDPSMDMLSAQIGNTEAGEVYDFDNGYGEVPSTSVLPGREVTYKVAFVGTDSQNAVVEYIPGDWDRGSLIYTPNGK